MDQITKLYKSRAEDLQRKIVVLEEQLKYIIEAADVQMFRMDIGPGKFIWKKVVDGKTVSFHETNDPNSRVIPSHTTPNGETVPGEAPKPSNDDNEEPAWYDKLLGLTREKFPKISPYLDVAGLPSTAADLFNFKDYPLSATALTATILGTTELPFVRIPPTSRFKPFETFTSYNQPVSLRPYGDIFRSVPGDLTAKPIKSVKSINPLTLSSRALAKYNVGRLGREGEEAARIAAEREAAAKEAERMRRVSSQATDAIRIAEKDIPPGDPRRIPAVIPTASSPIPKTPLTDVGREHVEDELKRRLGNQPLETEVRDLIRTSDALRDVGRSLEEPLSTTRISDSSAPSMKPSGKGGAVAVALEPPQYPRTPQEWLDAFKRGVAPDVEAARMAGREVSPIARNVAGKVGRYGLPALALSSGDPSAYAAIGAEGLAGAMGGLGELGAGMLAAPFLGLAFTQSAGDPAADARVGLADLERKEKERSFARSFNPLLGEIDRLYNEEGKRREAEQLRQYEEEQKKKEKETNEMLGAIGRGMSNYHP